MALPLSISVTDIFKLFRDRGITDKNQVTTYIEAIAADAESLCGYWARLCERAKEPTESIYQPPLQQFWYYKLFGHYQRASRVLSGRLPLDQQEELFDALGNLLDTRNALKRAFAQVIDDGTKQNVLELVEVLQKEAATLSAIATEIKATK